MIGADRILPQRSTDADHPLRLPPRGVVLLAFIAAYLLPGLFGHDPWKTEDALGFGITYGLLSGGDWLTLHLAGEPFVRDGPLYYWAAAVLAQIAAFALPLHDGARLASLLFGGLTLYFTRLAARELYGKDQGDLSTLALLGCLGFLVHVREVAPHVATLAGSAAAYYGLAIAWKKPLKAGVMFGGGIAGGLLAGGALAVLPTLVAAILLLPMAMASNTRSYVRAVGIGVASATAISLAWLVPLAIIHPDYFAAFQSAQWARLASPAIDVSIDQFKTLAWLAWPAWPLSIWAMWAFRRNLRNPSFAVPFAGGLVTLATLLVLADSREPDALALLVPLSIPAGAAAIFLRRGAANALAWFSLMTFTLLALALWAMWFAMITGWPAQMAANVAKLEPGFEPVFQPFAVATALFYSLLWASFVRRAELSTLRSIPFWSAGLALVWGLAMTLWLGWIDYGKSYRPVAQGLQAAIAEAPGCIASRDLGEVQRATFHYHGGLLTKRLERGAGAECPWLLVQASSRHPETTPDPGWEKAWEGARPRDRERYRLYRRLAPV